MTHDNGAAGAELDLVQEFEKAFAHVIIQSCSLGDINSESNFLATPLNELAVAWERLRSSLRAPQPQEAVTFATLTSVDGPPVAAPGTPFNGICTINEQVQSAALRAPQEGDTTTIELSPADQTQLVDALLNPPEPNDALRKAMSRHIAPQEGKDRQ